MRVEEPVLRQPRDAALAGIVAGFIPVATSALGRTGLQCVDLYQASKALLEDLGPLATS